MCDFVLHVNNQKNGGILTNGKEDKIFISYSGPAQYCALLIFYKNI